MIETKYYLRFFDDLLKQFKLRKGCLFIYSINYDVYATAY